MAARYGVNTARLWDAVMAQPGLTLREYRERLGLSEGAAHSALDCGERTGHLFYEDCGRLYPFARVEPRARGERGR